MNKHKQVPVFMLSYWIKLFFQFRIVCILPTFLLLLLVIIAALVCIP